MNEAREVDDTIVVPRFDDDRTVVVRRPRAEHAVEAAVDAGPGVAAPAGLPTGDDETVMRADLGDETVVRGVASDATVVRPGRAAAEALTRSSTAAAATRAMRVALPDRIAPSANAATGVGVDAVQAYRPRPIPAPPRTPVGAVGGERATRADAPGLPSVRRASRRTGFVALAWLAGACAVTIAGLAALCLVAFAG
ncbi:hypothetical protein [Humibacter ginsenosidimutans]|uniref:Uncharacterized protein n=1 Tax=Humibacter ginsenosidimutans TaxID=2599293 RepID=A0A5B8M232_9MICO|nr:hypothetical protein [Humibacter ginsenosidimutans]QDZ14121.1 hypothetical protein FPZ11_04415 [Humibacter ginsenosidimutans]